MSIRVLIADDFPLAREGIASALQTCPEVKIVGEASDGREALERGRELLPDVLLLDLRMPASGGMEALYTIRRELPATRVLILTAREDPEVLIDAMAAGAAGYLTKRSTADEICKAVIAVDGGDSVISPALAAELAREYAAASASLHAPSVSALSERERQIVRLVSEGYTDDEIGDQISVSMRTVQYEVAKIKRELGLARRSEIVHWAVRHSLG